MNNNTKEEIWKDVVGYEGLYMVSNTGKVKSLDREILHKNGKIVFRKGRLLVPYLGKAKYERVKLSKDGEGRKFMVHRVVAYAFLGEPDIDKFSSEKAEVNHKDGNTQNNNVENLEWVTKEENMLHARENGFTTHGTTNGRAVLDDRDVSVIRRLYHRGVTQKILGESYGVERGTISSIVRNETWTRI